FTLNNTGTNGGGDAQIVISGNDTQNIISSVVCINSRLPNILIDKPSGTLNMSGNITVNGNWEYLRGTVNPGTSEVCFWTSGKIIDCQGITQTMAFYDARLSDNFRRTLQGNMMVNNQLFLGSGNINMNTYSIEIKNPLPAGITRTSGYIASETDPIAGYGRLIWNIRNSGPGNNYVVPF